MVGATLPNVTALALGSVRERMGSAAALQGTAQSVVAGVAGWLVGVQGNGAALPVMGIITGFAILAAVFVLAAHRWQPETHMVPQPTLCKALDQVRLQ